MDRKRVSQLAEKLIPAMVRDMRGKTCEWCVEESIKTAEFFVTKLAKYEAGGQEESAKEEQKNDDDSKPVEKTPAKKSTKKTTK